MKVSDILEEYKELPSHENLEVLTLTEKNGFVPQADRFHKRLATQDTSKYRVVNTGDFAYNPYLLWAGAIAVNERPDPGIISPVYPTFRLKEGFDPGYIFALLLSPLMLKRYDTISYGSVPRRRRAATKDFLNLTVPDIPPLEEQQRIATILGTVEKAIHFSLEALSARQLLRKSVIEKVLEQNSEAPSLSLSQIAEISSGITKGRKVRPDTPLTDTPYLAVSNVKDGYLDLGTVSTIAITDHEKSRFALHDGDILLTEGGDPDKLGRGVVWRGEIEGAIHQNHIFRCRLNEETNYNPEALMAVISSQGSKQYFLQCAKQTTGIATINKTQLSKLKVPDLDSGVLNRMQEMLHKVDNEILLSHRKIELLRELYASLSSRAFAGEL